MITDPTLKIIYRFMRENMDYLLRFQSDIKRSIGDERLDNNYTNLCRKEIELFAVKMQEFLPKETFMEHSPAGDNEPEPNSEKSEPIETKLDQDSNSEHLAISDKQLESDAEHPATSENKPEEYMKNFFASNNKPKSDLREAEAIEPRSNQESDLRTEQNLPQPDKPYDRKNSKHIRDGRQKYYKLGEIDARGEFRNRFSWTYIPIPEKTNYLSKMPRWTLIALGYLNGELHKFLILEPATGNYYWGRKNGGIFTRSHRIRTRDVRNTEKITIGIDNLSDGTHHLPSDLVNIKDRIELCVSTGSPLLDLIDCAAGKLHMFVAGENSLLMNPSMNESNDKGERWAGENSSLSSPSMNTNLLPLAKLIIQEAGGINLITPSNIFIATSSPELSQLI